MKETDLKLRKVLDADLKTIEKWLNKEYILKWYNDPKEWLTEIRKRQDEFIFIHHYIATKNNMPIGFCQYYDCFYAKEDWYKVEKEGTIFSIDYLIGEEKYLHKGYGKQMIFLLKNEIKLNSNAKKIIVQPDVDNIQSNKLLEATGFLYDENQKYYYFYY
jgi:RimJ/RimL family protein N-acetyltransferase